MGALFSEQDLKSLGRVAGWLEPLQEAVHLVLKDARGCDLAKAVGGLVDVGNEFQQAYRYIDKAERLGVDTEAELSAMHKTIHFAQLRFMGDVVQALQDSCGCKPAP